MRRRIFLLATFSVAVFVTMTLANDEVFVRSKQQPYKGPIKSESSRGIEITGVKQAIPAEEIVDIIYDLTPVEVRINVYRPAVQSENKYNEPDPLNNQGMRKAQRSDAMKKN